MITGQVTDPATKITTVSYKVIPSDQVEQDQGFVAMRMSAFNESDSNDSGTAQTMALDVPESESLTTLADDPIRITFTIRDNYGGVIYHQVDYSVDDSGALVDVATGGAPQGPVIVDSARHRAYQITYVASPTDNPQNRQFNGTTYVTVIDTTTGKAIGSGPAAVPGKMQTNETPQITGDGSHMFVTTQIEQADGTRTTYVAVIDTETGELVDNDGGDPADKKVTVLHGQADERLLIKGDKAYLHTVGFDPGHEDEGAKTFIAVFNTADGELASGSVIESQEAMDSRSAIITASTSRATTSPTPKPNSRSSIPRRALSSTTARCWSAGSTTATWCSTTTRRTAAPTSPHEAQPRRRLCGCRSRYRDRQIHRCTNRNRRCHSSRRIVLSEHGERAYLVTSAGDYANGEPTSTTITVIDAATGATSTLKTVNGVTNDDLILDNSGRAYLSTYEQLSLGHFATTITVIGADGSLVDTATVGTTPTSPLTRSTDGNVVYQAFVTATDDGTGNYTTKTIIVVFDTDTGTSAPEIEMLGTFPTDPRTQKLIGGFTDKGDNIYVVTESYDVNDPEDPTDVTRTTHVAIINTETGEQLGDPVAIDGRTLGGLIVDGDRAYQRTVGWSPSGDEPRIRIGVIDANTGDLLSAREIDGSLDQYTDGRTGEVFFDRLVFTDTDGDGINDRVHQAAASQNADGTYTVRIVTLNARTGDLIKTESVPVSSNGVKILEAKDNGRVYLVVNGTDYSNPSGPSFQTTFVTIDADTGEVVGRQSHPMVAAP